MNEQNDDLSALLSAPSHQKNGGRREKKTKSPLTLLVVIALLGLLLAGGIWVLKQFLDKGEVEVPLPPKVAQTITEVLRLDEGGRLGPVKIVGGENPQRTVPERPGNTVGEQVKEDEGRPSAGGLAAAPGQSAENLVGGMPQGVPPEGQQEVRQKVHTGADAVITIGFVNDLALFLAESYWPQGSHLSAVSAPYSTANVSRLNQRYGIELTGFTSARTRAGGKRDYFRERALVLNYAFTPSMIKALSRLYADRFAEQLAFLGRQQTRAIDGTQDLLDDAEVARMLRFYAVYVRQAGAALLAYAENPDAPAVMAALQKAEHDNYNATNHMHEARYAFELAEEDANGVRPVPRAAIADLEKSEQAYRDAMLFLQNAREQVAEMMQSEGAEGLDTENLIYIASWAARRGSDSLSALRAASEAAQYTAMVLDEQANELEGVTDGVEYGRQDFMEMTGQ